MEILLLQDLPGMGKKNDVLVVGDGFAMNNLLPNRIALVATPTVRRRYAEQIRRRAEDKAKEMAAGATIAAGIQGKTLKIKAKADGETLYGAITEEQIAAEINAQLDAKVAVEAIKVAAPIKAIGDHEVRVALPGAEVVLKLQIKAETAKKKAAKATAKPKAKAKAAAKK